MTDYQSSDWSEFDNENTGVSPNGVQGGYSPSSVAPIIRAIRGAAKREFVRSTPQYTSTGTAPSYVLTFLVAATAYNKGDLYRFFAHADTTGPATININGLGTKSLLSQRGEPLSAGQIKTGDVLEIVYDGTSFRIISNEKHNPKLTGVLNLTDPAPSILFTNTTNTAANTNVRFGMVGNNAVLTVGAANTLTVSANNLTVAG